MIGGQDYKTFTGIFYTFKLKLECCYKQDLLKMEHYMYMLWLKISDKAQSSSYKFTSLFAFLSYKLESKFIEIG